MTDHHQELILLILTLYLVVKDALIPLIRRVRNGSANSSNPGSHVEAWMHEVEAELTERITALRTQIIERLQHVETEASVRWEQQKETNGGFKENIARLFTRLDSLIEGGKSR